MTYLDNDDPHPNQHYQRARKGPQSHADDQPQNAAHAHLSHVGRGEKAAPCGLGAGCALLAQEGILGVHGPGRVG